MGAVVPAPQPSPEELLKGSVHETADANRNPISAGSLLMIGAAVADGIVPWGQSPKMRDRQLREFWPSESYLAGALSTVVARSVSFDWKLEGGTATADAAEMVLNNSEYGKGWKHLWVKLCFDVYSQDTGAYIQIIRHNPNDPLSPVANLSALDSWRCYQTGNPKTPVAYLDRKNRWHYLEWFQVRNLMEMPAPVENIFAGVLFELQYCAISRMLRAAQVIRNITIMKEEKTAGRFTRAIHVISGVQQKEIDDAITMHRMALDNAGLMRYGQPLILPTLNPDAKIALATLELASMPEGWDEEKSLKSYLIALAMGFLTDYQEFSPLPGGNLGSGAQSNVLHLKSTGKGPMLYKAMVSQLMNFGGILPQNVEFKWDEQDVEMDKAEADVAKTRADTRAVMIANGEVDDLGARAMAVASGDLDEGLLAELESRDAQRKLDQAAAQQAQVDALASEPKVTNGALPAKAGSQPPLPAAAQKMVAGLVDLITMDVKDNERATRLGSFLQTRIHKAFTMAADDLAAMGYMDTEGRIALSSVIGDTLREFADLTGQDADEDLFATCMQMLNSDDIEHLVKAVGKALELPPGRKKAEAAARDVIQHEVFDDIWEKVSERLTAQHVKELMGYSHGPGGALSFPGAGEAKPKKKRTRTRTKVLRDGRGRVVDTDAVTEEL